MSVASLSTDGAGPRIAIVDDDQNAAIAAGWDVERAGFRPLILDGPYGADIEALANEIASTAEGALCDHRLAHRGFASFNGATLAASLFDRGLPAILVTQYKEIDTDVSIRKWRYKIPVLLSRDDTNAMSIKAGMTACMAELKGDVPITRRPHRVLLRIVDVGQESREKVLDVIIPSWNPQKAVRLPASLISQELRGKLKRGVRLLASVNIGAETSDELYFEEIELALEPDKDDGLA